MPGKGIQGRSSLVPRCQCKSYMVKAELPEAQSNGVYMDHSGARRAEKPFRKSHGISNRNTMKR